MTDLTQQTDALLKAISHLETTLHQDMIAGTIGVCGFLVVLILVVIIRR